MESPKTIPNVGKITLDDSSMNDHNIDNATQGNRSLDNEMKYPQLGGSLSNGGGDLDSLTPKVVEKTGDTQNGVQETKPTVKKPATRAKVPFEKGYFQMDWLKRTRTDPDLAGNFQFSYIVLASNKIFYFTYIFHIADSASLHLVISVFL